MAGHVSAHINPSTQKAEAGGSEFQVSKPDIHSDSEKRRRRRRKRRRRKMRKKRKRRRKRRERRRRW
jgi:hypothetical protein